MPVQDCDIRRIERIFIAVPELEAARQLWSKAGFAVGAVRDKGPLGLLTAQAGCGAIRLEFCALSGGASGATHGLRIAVEAKLEKGGGVLGWLWGTARSPRQSGETVIGYDGDPVLPCQSIVSGLWNGMIGSTAMLSDLKATLTGEFGANPNTVEYLDHVVLMVPNLDNSIARCETMGLPCKRVREAGRGLRQAFFKLEETVIEVVGPSVERTGCWGLAFMCRDIERAVAEARRSGLQSTSPKAAVQGGRIARIVEPLDNVAVAFMGKPPGATRA